MKKIVNKASENIGEFLSGKEYKKSAIMFLALVTGVYVLVSHRIDGEISSGLLDYAKFVIGIALGTGGLNVAREAFQAKRDKQKPSAYNDGSYEGNKPK